MDIEIVVSAWVLFVLVDVVRSLSQYCSYLFLMFPFFSRKINCCKQKWWIGWRMRDQPFLKPKRGFPSDFAVKAGLQFNSSLALGWRISAEETWIKSFKSARCFTACLIVSSRSWSLQMCFTLWCRYERRFFNGLEDEEGSFFLLIWEQSLQGISSADFPSNMFVQKCWKISGVHRWLCPALCVLVEHSNLQVYPSICSMYLFYRACLWIS